MLAPERPQLKEVQSWGSKEPQAFISIMVGTVPAPEQHSLGGWWMQWDCWEEPPWPRLEAGQGLCAGAALRFQASVQTMPSIVHCQAQMGTDNGDKSTGR